MLNDSGVKAIVVGQRYQDMIRSVKPELTTLEHQITLEAPADDFVFYEDLLANSSDEERFPSADGEDVTIVMFTAGTTGTPKGVMLSHNSFSSYILANVEPVDMDMAEKNILTVPLHHIAGVQAVMAAIYGGRTLVLQRQFDEEGWMKLVQDEKVNRAMMVPTMLKRLMDQPTFGGLRPVQPAGNHLRRGPHASGGHQEGHRRVPQHALHQRLWSDGDGIHHHDAAAGRSRNPRGRPGLRAEDEAARLHRQASAGRGGPALWTRDGHDVALGENGEIVARGERLMKGYWNREEATRETLRGGWLYTGDLGYWDDEGYIFLSGRAKDFLKRGGEMIAPEEVEADHHVASCGRRGCHHRSAGHRVGRARQGHRCQEARHGSERGGRGRALPAPHGGVQAPRGRDLHRGAAQEPDGQGAQAGSARGVSATDSLIRGSLNR